MKIGLSMLFCLNKPFSSVIRRLNEFDVDCVELVDESLHALNPKRVDALKKISSETGLEFTVHAPFADINIASPNPALLQVILKSLEKSLYHARQLGSRQWIFHPGWKSGISEFFPNIDWETNFNSVNTLLKMAKKLEVNISIENPPDPMHFLVKHIKDFSQFFSELGSEIGLTLDVAHAHTTGQTLKFIKKFSSKITHVHISDNDGKSDAHKGIGYGTIDWHGVADALRRINYKGVVTLESIDNVRESLETMRQIFS